MTPFERSVDLIHDLLVTDAATSDPGLTWSELAYALRSAGIWSSPTTAHLRRTVGFALREIRAGSPTRPALPVVCGEGYAYRIPSDRDDAARWLRRTGGKAMDRTTNLTSYVDTAATVFGHVDMGVAPGLWVATRSTLTAASTTMSLAFDASFG